jgi:putrescine---pyruvate transaminase
VITGFGRTGAWFAIEHWGVEPDMVTMAKAMTAGYMPLGAVTVRDEIWEALPAFPDVHTFGGHAAAGVAALAAIGVYEAEGLIDRARDSGEHMLGLMHRLERHEIVGQVRGLGLWAAVDFTEDRESRAPLGPEAVRRILIAARRHGLIVTQNGGAIELAPPLNVPLEELDEGVELLDRAIGDRRDGGGGGVDEKLGPEDR